MRRGVNLTGVLFTHGLQELLLVLIFRVDELADETVHDREFSELGPEEVDLLRLFLLVEEPPEAVLKERAH